jgi:hypothetical protein
MIKKKAQLQINETMIVLFIFILLVMFGVVFFARIHRYNIAAEQTALQNLDLIKLSQAISSMPELSCSVDNVQKENCFDMMKMEAFEKILEINPNYFSGTLMYYTNITIKQYDPFNDQWTNTWNLYNNPLDSSDIRKVFVPVMLYDKRTSTKNFGLLELTWYT